MMHRYAVVFERAPGNWSAYPPDLPGCVSVGDTLQEAKAMIREAIEFHIEGMRLHGKAVEPPSMSICDAMRFHVALVTEDGQEPPDTETTFDMVEVEVEFMPAPALRG